MRSECRGFSINMSARRKTKRSLKMKLLSKTESRPLWKFLTN